MKTNTFITLSTATANIGVLVGLVFLIFELRQNSAIALSQIRQERTLSIIDEYSAIAQDEIFSDLLARALNDGDFDAITNKEWNQLVHYEMARSVRLEDVFFQYKKGLLDESVYLFSISMAASRLPIWKWLNVSEPNPEFAAAIGSYMSTDDFTPSALAIQFAEWSANKDSPNKGLGTPKVF